jgi:TATA-binding protein-associated factor
MLLIYLFYSLQRFKLGIANSVVNIENSSLSSMGTEQLITMFNKEENQKQNTNKTNTDKINHPTIKNNFQRILENITEIWDENQYETEFNISNFINSIKN